MRNLLKVIINKKNGQINLNPPLKKLPSDIRKKLRQDPSSVRALVKWVKMKNGKY